MRPWIRRKPSISNTGLWQRPNFAGSRRKKNWSGKSGRIEDWQWERTFAVNVTGAYILADEARKIFTQQNLPANIVITTSANAVVAKKGSLAYDASKAAANHLVRELAVEMAPLVRVNAVAPATVVKGSTMFPRSRVVASLN